MNKTIIRAVSFALCILMITGLLPLCTFAEEKQTLSLEQLKTIYPDGKYWNSGDPLTVTDTPCDHHKTNYCSKNGTDYSGWCGCNSYRGMAIQCMGFAYQLGHTVYGDDPYYDWQKKTGDSALDSVKAGDIVRYRNNGHSIFVTDVTEDTITYVDCNWNHTCKIRWDVSISKETLKASFTYLLASPYEWDTESEGEIPVKPECDCIDVFAGEYKCVTENYPLSIRAGHGTSYSKIGEIPKGATVTVTKADGSWAHITYGDVSGYASLEYLEYQVPSDKKTVEQIAEQGITDTIAEIKGEGYKNSEVALEYDKNIISATYENGKLKVTPLKPGTTTLSVRFILKGKTIAGADYEIIVTHNEHVYSEFVPDNNATWETDGTKTRKCTLCDQVETVTDEGTKLQNSSELFKDVKNDAWYKYFIDYAVTKNIFSGTSENEFSPMGIMTRAQFVQVFANISGVNTDDINAESTFADVKSGAWYLPAVNWAAQNGIVSGVGDGKFDPDAPVTREQMCVMIVNYTENYKKLAFDNQTENIEFSDNDSISSWAKDSVYKCQMANLVSGDDKGNFNPINTASRAEGATIFTDFHKQYIKKPE